MPKPPNMRRRNRTTERQTDGWTDTLLQTAPEYNVLREQKRRHTPLQLIPLGFKGHLGARFVADLNAINLIEAIFEFPTHISDMEGERAIFG